MKYLNFVLSIVFIYFAINCGKQEEKSLGDMDFGVLTPEQKTEKIITLQFNDEAQNDPKAFVQFKFLTKEGDEFPKDQIQFVVDGVDHSLMFYAKDYKGNNKNIRVGIRFSENAKEQVYEGRFVVVNASPDLRQYITYGEKKEPVIVGDRTSGLNAKFEWTIPWPLWQKISVPLLVILLVCLIVWFVFLKNIFFVQFDGGVIEILEPVQQEIKLRDSRMLYLGDNMKYSQTSLSKIFTGAVNRELKGSPIGIQIYPVKIKNKVWHKIKNDTSTVLDPLENTLFDFVEYKLTGSDNQTIKFVYKNSKHQPMI